MHLSLVEDVDPIGAAHSFLLMLPVDSLVLIWAGIDLVGGGAQWRDIWGWVMIGDRDLLGMLGEGKNRG